jgi:drug/metabolite transporter (DMT)-like permease
MLIGYLLLSAMPMLVRLVGRHGWSAASTTAVRFGLGTLAIALLVLFAGQRLKTAQPIVLLLRGAFGGVSVLAYFFAVQQTGAGMGTLLNYTNSIWSNLFGLLLFRQRPDWRFWPMLAVALLRLWLVIDPSLSNFEIGKFYGLLSGVLGGAAILCLKQLRHTDNALTIMASFCGVGLCFALLMLPFDRAIVLDGSDGAAWAMLVAVVALGSLMSLLVPTLSTLSGWAILDERLTAKYALGATLVLTACGVFGWVERRAQPPGVAF